MCKTIAETNLWVDGLQARKEAARQPASIVHLQTSGRELISGVSVRNGLDSAMGVELCRVDDHSQLYHSGIREGDVLLAVGTAACLSHTHALLTR